MRSARSSRSLRPERTPCPHCGRDTRTASDGICVECWGPKRPGSQAFPRRGRRERGYFWEELDDFFGGLFDLGHGGGWIGFGLALLLVLAAVLLVALR
jgi:hypothetical protein